MAKWVHNDVLDGGLNAIKNGATQVRVISTYAAGDTYSTVNTNTLATLTIAATDLLITTVSNTRVLTFTPPSTDVADVQSTGTDLHLAFIDGANSKVLWVTDETSNSSFVAGATLTLPTVTYTANQPA